MQRALTRYAGTPGARVESVPQTGWAPRIGCGGRGESLVWGKNGLWKVEGQGFYNKIDDAL